MTTDKTSALMLTALMVKYGIRMVFASPGSRNVPLLIAFTRNEDIKVEMVVDERSAAFMALGYAAVSGEPVALLCTSGTAMLNYMPAVAEAYHRHIPLVVITADRPSEWIGQKDSQTLVQPCGLEPYVKRSVDIPDFAHDDMQKRWWCNRVINDVLTICCDSPKAPVHINMQFDMPLNALTDEGCVDVTKIASIRPSGKLDTGAARELGRRIASPHKVMVVIGNMPPSQRVTKAVMKLTNMPNVVVLAENLANIHADRVLTQIDAVIAKVESMSDSESYKPDTVIYMGGSIVSGRLKKYLRKNPPCQCWYVGKEDNVIDTFQSLTLRIDMEPDVFLPQLASAMYPHRAESGYADIWRAVHDEINARLHKYLDKIAWSSFKAVAKLLAAVPSRWNVELSNGMSIRIAQHIYAPHIHRWSCNRGVSGIDGSTSTAVGAQLAYRHGATLLITGDMSQTYDLTALGTAQVTNLMRVVVLDNGGGNIFRCIPSTEALPELETCLELGMNTPFGALARDWGWECMEAYDESTFDSAMETFMSDSDKPCMLVVKTDGRYDASVWKDYFDYITE
ncbi:MAG: 2-succinyl-5-enolpyruvyl-6-hydroxy-3-cyclohexene-1-carboxylic-acid synthase [Candidatus Amulumruptor sp.]